MLNTRNTTAKRMDTSQNLRSRTYLKPGAVSLGTTVNDSDDSDGWETDLECEECKPEYDPTGRTIYLRACEKLGITPASFFLRHMTEPTVSMMHHGLGPKGVRAMALALLYNTTITILNIRDNGIGEEGGEIMAKLLRENYYIVEMDISENQIGSQSIAEIAQTLKENYTLTKLGLAGNCLDDKDAHVLCDALLVNCTMTHLDLSSNKFSNKACRSFARVLDENITLTELDLSWNHIQVKGGETLAKGLKGNVKLKVLNLAWNGLASEGARAFAGALIENRTLREIDISSNRISDKGAFSIARGLENNTAIEIIRLANNNLQNNGACTLINAVLRNGDSRVSKLDLTGALVGDEFYGIAEELKKLKEVAVITNDNPEEKVKRCTPDPSTLLQKYIAKEHVHVVDLFRELDQDGSMQVSIREFVKGLRKSDLGLTQFEVEKIIEILDVDKDGEIDYSEFVSIQAEWKKKEKRKMYCE